MGWEMPGEVSSHTWFSWSPGLTHCDDVLQPPPWPTSSDAPLQQQGLGGTK